MVELAHRESFEDESVLVGRRLILGFDGGCVTCSDLARRIKTASEGKLEVLSLHDPVVKKWRKKALGEDSPSAPTLFEIHDAKVKAWIGLRMGAHLSRRLGPVVTWRIMQALGEVKAAYAANDTPAARVLSGMSRGQFLKGVGGVVVATSVLSGFGPLVRPAEALEDWQYPNFTDSRILAGAALEDWVNRVRQRDECIWTCGGDHGSRMQQSTLQCADSDSEVASGSGVKARAAIHTMKNGNRMRATSFVVGDEKILTHYQYDEPFRNRKYEVKRWGLNSEGSILWLERATINGQRYTDPNAPSLSSRSAQASCPSQCQGACGMRQTTECSSYVVGCLLNLAGSCIATPYACQLARSGSLPAILACAGAILVCAGSAINGCCRTTCTVCTPCGSTVNPC